MIVDTTATVVQPKMLILRSHVGAAGKLLERKVLESKGLEESKQTVMVILGS